MPNETLSDPWKTSYKRAQDAHRQHDFETARKDYLRALEESSHLPAHCAERIHLKVGLVKTLCSEGNLKTALNLIKDTRKALERAFADDTYRLAEMEQAIVFSIRSRPVNQS